MRERKRGSWMETENFRRSSVPDLRTFGSLAPSPRLCPGNKESDHLLDPRRVCPVATQNTPTTFLCFLDFWAKAPFISLTRIQRLRNSSFHPKCERLWVLDGARHVSNCFPEYWGKVNISSLLSYSPHVLNISDEQESARKWIIKKQSPRHIPLNKATK